MWERKVLVTDLVGEDMSLYYTGRNKERGMQFGGKRLGEEEKRHASPPHSTYPLWASSRRAAKPGRASQPWLHDDVVLRSLRVEPVQVFWFRGLL